MHLILPQIIRYYSLLTCRRVFISSWSSLGIDFLRRRSLFLQVKCTQDLQRTVSVSMPVHLSAFCFIQLFLFLTFSRISEILSKQRVNDGVDCECPAATNFSCCSTFVTYAWTNSQEWFHLNFRFIIPDYSRIIVCLWCIKYCSSSDFFFKDLGICSCSF